MSELRQFGFKNRKSSLLSLYTHIANLVLVDSCKVFWAPDTCGVNRILNKGYFTPQTKHSPHIYMYRIQDQNSFIAMSHLLINRFLRWLESPPASMLVTLSHVPYDVIKNVIWRHSVPLRRKMRNVFSVLLNNIIFTDISAFTACFTFGFLDMVLYEQSNHIALKRVYSYSTLTNSQCCQIEKTTRHVRYSTLSIWQVSHNNL